MLLLTVGGELDTAFVLTGIYCDDFPAPSASADGWRVEFPDGAVIEYEPDTGKLTVSGIKIADVTASASVVVTCPSVTVTASQKITLDTPEVWSMCGHRLKQILLFQHVDIKNQGLIRGLDSRDKLSLE